MLVATKGKQAYGLLKNLILSTTLNHVFLRCRFGELKLGNLIVESQRLVGLIAPGVILWNPGFIIPKKVKPRSGRS